MSITMLGSLGSPLETQLPFSESSAKHDEKPKIDYVTLLLSKVSPGLNSSILGSYFETVKLYLFIS